MENSRPATIEQLPFEQFKLLGMEKKDVLALPKQTIDALLSGNRTSLIQFNGMKINGMSEPATINAKLSIQKVGDTYELKMHPVNLSPKNNLELSEKEIEFLKKDPLNILPKMVVGSDGKLVDSFISLDRTTNDFVAVKRDKIRSPESINDVFLSEAQKKDFLNGKPIQLGNEKYQMDVNSETGVSGNNIQKMKFKTAEYNAYNVLLDAALIISGLGIFVMVEHIAKLAFNNREKVHELMKQDLKPAVKRTVASIKEKANNGVHLTNKDKNDIFVVNVKDTIQMDKQPVLSNEPIVVSSSVEQPKHDYTGKLLEHGRAPYEFKEDNKENYFVKLGTESGEKLIWGVDFGRAIPESRAKIGDTLGIDYYGIKPVNVDIPIKDVNGETIFTETRSVERNDWNVVNLGADHKLEQKLQATIADQPTKQSANEEKTVGVDIPPPGNHFHIKVDATKNIEEQKLAANNQITSQLSNYDGKGDVTVHREIATKPIDRSNTEGQMAFSFQEVMVDRLKEHITREVHKQTNAIRIGTTDEIKMAHPEQRQATETKTVLEKDTGKQNNITANATDSIKKDNKEIEQVKKGMKR